MTTMDLLPTFAKLARAEIPTDRVIDGKDIREVLMGTAKSPHAAFFYHRQRTLEAVRSGPWKLRVKDNKPVALYNLEDDIGETHNVFKENPTVVEKLLALTVAFQEEIVQQRRPAAFVKDPKPLSK